MKKRTEIVHMFLPKKKDTTHNVYVCYEHVSLLWLYAVKNFNCLLRERFFIVIFIFNLDCWDLHSTFCCCHRCLQLVFLIHIITFFYYFLFFNHKLSIFCIYFFFFFINLLPSKFRQKLHSLTLDNCHASITICTHMC